MKKQNQKGITLIALIITIIVMLILVAVTVNVAINGGLFNTAKDASRKTQLEADKEVLQAGIIPSIDTNTLTIPNEQTLEDNLPEGWKVTGTDGGPYTATSPKENEFNVTQNGEITEVIKRNSTPLERYIFGDEGRGRDLVADKVVDPDTGIFIDKSLDVKFLTGYTIEVINENESLDEVYIECEEKVYKFEMKENTEAMTFITDPARGIVALEEPQEGTKVGKYVQYDGKDWVVLYDDTTNGLQMISEDVLEANNVYLGYRDETAQRPGDVDKDGTANTDKDKAIYSYNNAIKRLNEKCASLVTAKEGIVKSVRSVGSNPINPYSENKTPYLLKNLQTGASERYNELGNSADHNYITDYDRLVLLRMGRHEEDYWLASRTIHCEPGWTSFGRARIADEGYNGGPYYVPLRRTPGEVVWAVTSQGVCWAVYNGLYNMRWPSGRSSCNYLRRRSLRQFTR